MGVTGLWTVVQPVGRRVKLETLNRRRLAVDASIWIYQFLKAVRDKEGNALRNSHVVGFFRRICKLLFFGIKPVFVFDGGAPIIKRQTISQRKARREGRREDAVRTAGKLLAVQMHRRAEEEKEKERRKRAEKVQGSVGDREVEEEPLPEDLNYVDEQLMTPAEKAKSRQFRKKDAYHLPDLDVSMAEMGGPNDMRIMSHEELTEYAKQFHSGEDISLYDFSKIDFDSPFFNSLPGTDRYNILNAARIRSRLRMGHSKEQLDRMFPDRMAFSRFQIERVKERNELTQRLMNINGMNPEGWGSGRIAGEKGKEYFLVKNDGYEGGWIMGVVSNKDEGQKEKPIDVDRAPPVPKPEDDFSDDSFEDVPIEGLNRLPKRPKRPDSDDENVELQRTLLDGVRATGTARSEKTTSEVVQEDEDTLFVPADEGSDVDQQFEDVLEGTGDSVEDEELQRAIQMSLQQDSDNESLTEAQLAADKARAERLRKEKILEFGKRNAASGRSFASYANARAAKAAPRPTRPDDDMNPELRAAFEAGRKMGHKKEEEKAPPPPPASSKPKENKNALAQPSQFKGPLPFESINLGTSLFSKKKPKTSELESESKQEKKEEGGFENDEEDDKDKPKPLPPWFADDMSKAEFERSHIQRPENVDDDTDRPIRKPTVLHRSGTGEIIELDDDTENPGEPIQIDDSGDEEMGQADLIDRTVTMDDVADKVRAEPPKVDEPQAKSENNTRMTSPVIADATQEQRESEASVQPEQPIKQTPPGAAVYSPGEDSFEWEESDYGDPERQMLAEDKEPSESRSSEEPEFEDVASAVDGSKSALAEMEADAEATATNGTDFEDVQVPEDEIASAGELPTETQDSPHLPEDDAFEQAVAEDIPYEDEFSDPEDEQLMEQLAVEAEEHARFAAQLNIATGLQSAADYEKELKQLRNQQKADRRDADEVTNIMIQECQQLLRLFGLPYITAPMEAEAQCAELVRLGLVDGIVTDDSDIFLFGGTRVYKNMFNQAKFVEYYLFNDLEKEYGLTREKIIQIAHLLGSDYTDGVPNVGPVTALEIMTEFGSVQAFRDWWNDVQTGVAPQDQAKGFKKRFRKNAAKIFLPPGFPDPRVDMAYLEPEVDHDPTQFQWGVPDLEALRQFLMATIGWSPERTDEILVPVIRDMNKRDVEGTQANLTQFMGFREGRAAAPGNSNANANAGASASREAYAPRRRQEGKSSRMESALERLHQQNKKRAAAAAGEGEVMDGSGDHGAESGEGHVEKATQGEKSRSAAPRKRKAAGKPKRRKARNEDEDGGDENNGDVADDDRGDGEGGDGEDTAASDEEEAYEPPKKASKKRASGRRAKA